MLSFQRNGKSQRYISLPCLSTYSSEVYAYPEGDVSHVQFRSLVHSTHWKEIKGIYKQGKATFRAHPADETRHDWLRGAHAMWFSIVPEGVETLDPSLQAHRSLSSASRYGPFALQVPFDTLLKELENIFPDHPTFYRGGTEKYQQEYSHIVVISTNVTLESYKLKLEEYEETESLYWRTNELSWWGVRNAPGLEYEQLEFCVILPQDTTLEFEKGLVNLLPNHHEQSWICVPFLHWKKDRRQLALSLNKSNSHLLKPNLEKGMCSGPAHSIYDNRWKM